MLAGQFGFDPGDHRAPSEGSEQKSNLPKRRDRRSASEKNRYWDLALLRLKAGICMRHFTFVTNLGERYFYMQLQMRRLSSKK